MDAEDNLDPYFGLGEDEWKAELDNNHHDNAEANIIRRFMEHNRLIPEQSDLSTSYELQRVIQAFQEQWLTHELPPRDISVTRKR